mgnify:CR=1 FL=1
MFIIYVTTNRVIRRAPGLKLVVETLLYSLKPIGNTVLIAAIFFLIFGILGVQVCVSIAININFAPPNIQFKLIQINLVSFGKSLVDR